MLNSNGSQEVARIVSPDEVKHDNALTAGLLIGFFVGLAAGSGIYWFIERLIDHAGRF